MPRANPDAIALIKQDHRHVEELFEKFEKARDEERKKTLAREICIELTIHAMIEEEIFYPACTGEAEDDTIDEAYVEHDGAKVIISDRTVTLASKHLALRLLMVSEIRTLAPSCST